jgi:hypothetical protein
MSDESQKKYELEKQSSHLEKQSSQSGMTRPEYGGLFGRRMHVDDTEEASARKKASKEYDAVAQELRRLEEREEASVPSPNPPEPTRSSGLPQWQRLLMAALHLIVGLVGFVLLLRISLAGAAFWFLFLLVAYPVALAFASRDQALDGHNLVKLYKLGVSQIPAIGEFLSRVTFGSFKKKDD